MSENKGHGLLDSAGVGVGVAYGVGGFIRIIFGLIILLVGDDDERAIQIKKEKKAWWRSLSVADKREYKSRIRQIKAYVRLRGRFHKAVQRRCYADFAANPPKPDEDWLWRQWLLAGKMWKEWNMASWDYVRDYPNFAAHSKGMKPSDGGVLERARFLPKDPVWKPPVWRR